MYNKPANLSQTAPYLKLKLSRARGKRAPSVAKRPPAPTRPNHFQEPNSWRMAMTTTQGIYDGVQLLAYHGLQGAVPCSSPERPVMPKVEVTFPIDSLTALPKDTSRSSMKGWLFLRCVNRTHGPDHDLLADHQVIGKAGLPVAEAQVAGH